MANNQKNNRTNNLVVPSFAQAVNQMKQEMQHPEKFGQDLQGIYSLQPPYSNKTVEGRPT